MRIRTPLAATALLTLARPGSVMVPRAAGGRFSVAVDVDTKNTTRIGIPFIPFCE